MFSVGSPKCVGSLYSGETVDERHCIPGSRFVTKPHQCVDVLKVFQALRGEVGMSRVSDRH